jgi:hypothetical protein
MCIYLTNNIVRVLNLVILFLVLFVSLILSSDVNAGWTNVGNVNGVRVYRDNDNDLEWTVSLSRTSSFGAARRAVANLGFRIPTHREFRTLEENGGIGRLGINTSWSSGYYWEASGNIVNGNGGNFASLFPPTRTKVGNPHIIGVRRGASGQNQGGGYYQEENTQPPIQPQPPIQSQPQTTGNSPRIHILFVWGTKDKDIYWTTKVSREKIIKALGYSDLNRGAAYVRTFVELEGDNAHPKKILETCRAISQKAGPNDAILVYMLCHGSSLYEDNDSEQKNRIHALSPVCVNAKNMDLRNIGIRRSSIMREIKSKPHRLNILITDSCSVLRQGELNVVAAAPPEPTRRSLKQPEISKLKQLLLHASGTININSSDPNKGSMDQGELALGWLPINPGVNNYLEHAMMDYHSGTIFTRAFISVASSKIPANEIYSSERFVRELKTDLKNTFNETVKWLENERGNAPEIKIFDTQGTQTLTQFDERGCAIP